MAANAQKHREESHTCVLSAEAGDDLRSSLQISIHVFLPQLPDDHAHPLQGGGERELMHDPDLMGLEKERRTASAFHRS